MGLCNVFKYSTIKTVKLSDSYSVTIKLDDKDFDIENNKYALRILVPENNTIEMIGCTSVTLPAYKTKEDFFEYGNNGKSFIYMDPKSLSDLELEFIENYDRNNELSIQNLVTLFQSKLFDEETFFYKLEDYIPEIKIHVYNNVFTKQVLVYTFNELKLVDYTKYNLDYASSDTAKWTLKFSFRSFKATTEENYRGEREVKEMEYFDKVPHVVEPVDNPIAAAQYEAMMAARGGQNAPSRSPNITAQEDLKNAEANLENLKKTKTLSLDKEQKELQNIKQQREELQKQLEDKKNSLAKNEANAAKFEQERQEASAEKFRAEEEKRQQEQSLFGLGSALTTAGYDDRIKSNEQWENRALNDRTNARKQANADRNDIAKLEAQLAELDKKESATTKTLNDKKAKNDAVAKEINNAKQQVNKLKEADKNTALKNEFNSTGEIPTGNKITNNPVDLTKLSSEDRIDELAYRMMRGELDNGKPRYDKTYEAGYTETERKAAQGVVNEKDWEGLKERHDTRVANNINENSTENNKPATQEQTALIEQPKPEPIPVVEHSKPESEPEPIKEQPKSEPVKERPKPKVQQNPDLITLTESDIDKYVPFLYKSMAKGYFNKYKDDQGTLTLVVNEQMINDNVPALFRSTAKNALKEYRADHPIEE